MSYPNVIVTDKEADESLKLLLTGIVEPAYEFFEPYSLGQINDNNPSTRKGSSNSRVDIKIKILTVIAENQTLPSSEYPKLAGISPNTFQKLRRLLLEEGLISEHKLQMVGRGRSRLVLGLTKKGEKFLQDYDNNQRDN